MTKDHQEKVFVVVDALSTGACVAEEAQNRGYKIVHVTSLAVTPELANMVPGHLRGGVLQWAVPPLGVDLQLADQDLMAAAKELAGRLDQALKAKAAESPDEMANLAQGLACICGIVAGAEPGVKLADFLVEAVNQAVSAQPGMSHFSLVGNGSAGSEARREKFEMGEKVRAAGVRAVKQMRIFQGDDRAQIKSFLEANWVGAAALPPHFAAVVKPVESAGSDGVTKCSSFDEVHLAVEKLIGSVNGLGQINEGVLIQEFLAGPEYVVDGVTCSAGKHKTAAVWKYDRRPANGAGFVLFGQFVVANDEPEVVLLRGYAAQVLDALDFAVGPSHMEVKLLSSGPNGDGEQEPCLVEVGARNHGAEGFWMSVCDEVYGPNAPNQVVLGLDSLLDPAEFEAAPAPGPNGPEGGAGCIKYLTLHRAGTLRKKDAGGPCHEAAMAALLGLPSYRGHSVFVTGGQSVTPTVDCFTWGGCIKLNNASRDQLMVDYALAEQLCTQGLWAWENE